MTDMAPEEQAKFVDLVTDRVVERLASLFDAVDQNVSAREILTKALAYRLRHQEIPF